MAPAPRGTLDGALTRASWNDSEDSEAECRDTCTMKGVKDWLTALVTALAISWTMVELGLTMDGDVKLGGNDVVAAGVKLNAEVEGEELCTHA